MAENVLKATITVTAPGVQQTFVQVAGAASKTENSLKKLTPATNSANLALINTGRVVQDLPFGFLGIANNLNPLLESFQRLRAESGSSKIAMQQLGKSFLGAGGLGFALSLASSALLLFTNGFQSFNRKTKEAKDSAEKFKEAVQGIFSSTAKEAAEVGGLIAVLSAETETRERKLAAIKELQRIQPDIFKNLKLEGDAVIGLDNAYKSYLDNLKTVIAAKIKQAQLEDLITKLLKAQGVTLTGTEKNFSDAAKSLSDFFSTSADGPTLFGKGQKKIRDESAKTTKQLQSDIDSLLKDLSDLSKGIKVKIDVPTNVSSEIDKIIAHGKRLAAEFGKLGEIHLDVLPIFSELDTKAEQLKKAQQIIKDVNEFFKDFSSKQRALRLVIPFEAQPLLIPPEPTIVNQTQAEITRVLKEIADFKPEVETKFDLTIDAAVRAEKFKKDLQAALAGTFGIKINVEGLSEAEQKMVDLQNQSIFTAETISGLLTPAFQNLFQAILDGEDPLKSFFEGLGQAVAQLIQKLIAAAVEALILAAIFGSIGGAEGFGAIFAKLLGFAEGGRPPVGKPSVVGERGPEVWKPDLGKPSLVGVSGPTLFKPDRPGVIIANHKMGQAVASMTEKRFVSTSTANEQVVIRNISKDIYQALQSIATTIVKQSDSVLRSVIERVSKTEKVNTSEIGVIKNSSKSISLEKELNNNFSTAVASVIKSIARSESNTSDSVSREKFVSTSTDSSNEITTHVKSSVSALVDSIREYESILSKFVSSKNSTKSDRHSETSTSERFIKLIYDRERSTHSILKTTAKELSRFVSTNKNTYVDKSLSSVLKSFTHTIGFRAKGGPVDWTKPFIVGERGPEIFEPRRSGRIVPNHKITRNVFNQVKNKSVTGSNRNVFSKTGNRSFSNRHKEERNFFYNLSKTDNSIRTLSSITNKPFAGFRANGGRAVAGTSLIVGGGGAELFIPNTGQNIVNNNQSSTNSSVSGGTLKVEGSIRIAGRDLIAAIANEKRSQNSLS